MKAVQFDSRVLGGESPFGARSVVVAASRPGSHFPVHRLDNILNYLIEGVPGYPDGENKIVNLSGEKSYEQS